MSMRFERNISGAAARSSSGLFERERFGVLETFVKIRAFADNFAMSVDNHAADQGARAHLPDAARRQFKRAAHHTFIKV